jgi:hypothetical protein
MKITIYIEKSEFDNFFKWFNRITLGIYSTPTVKYSHRQEDIDDPLRVTLDSREYTLIQDIEKDLNDIQNTYGPLEIDFSPTSTGNNLLIIQDILKEADRFDLRNEVVYTALQIAQQLPDITPIESMIIAEREWLYDHQTHEE